MNNNLKKTGWALLIALTFFACKKEQKQTDLADDAKSWYLKTSQKTSYALASGKNKNLTAQVSQQVDWNNAQTIQLDGKEILSAPLSLKLANGSQIGGSYMLMIEKVGDGFKKLTVYNGDKDFFKSISKEKVQSAYNLANKLSEVQKRANNNPGKGKIMGNEIGGEEGDQPVCTDWYLIETIRDENGNVVAVFETYLFQTCTYPGQGGGGGGGGQDNVEFEWGDLGKVVSDNISSSPETSETIEGELFKISNLHWKFYNGYTWSLKSQERGIVKVSGGVRTWHSLTHTSISQDGGWLLGDVAPVNVVATPHLEPLPGRNSWMEIDFGIKFTPGISIPVGGSASPVRYSLPPRYLDNQYAVASWDTFFEKK